MDAGFYSGSLIDVILCASSSNSASMDAGFYSGSLITLITVSSTSEIIDSITIGLYSGSYDSV
jgi:hypothetical protein